MLGGLETIWDILHRTTLPSAHSLPFCVISPSSAINSSSTRSAAILPIGEPDTVSAKDDTEYMVYRLATEKDYSMAWYFGMSFAHKNDYFVRLVDGTVDAYGRFGDFDSTKDPKLQIDLDADIESK